MAKLKSGTHWVKHVEDPNANTALDAVGKSHGVFKLTNEAPHCSADGR